MQKAAELREQIMCSVAGLERGVLENICKQALDMKLESDPVCQITNSLFPLGFAVGGTKKTIEELCKIALNARAFQAKPVKTCGAFHTPLMSSAVGVLAEAIDEVKDKMQPHRCCIYFNVPGKITPAGTDPTAFADMMKAQMISEVFWEGTMKQMIMDGVNDFYECGPMKHLKAMIKLIDTKAFKRTENIQV